jgi:two-component system OmpR family sensor kinase
MARGKNGCGRPRGAPAARGGRRLQHRGAAQESLTARARPEADPGLDSLGLVHDLRSPLAAAARAFQVLEALLGQPQEATRPLREAVRTSLERAERVMDDWQQLLLPHTANDETAAREAVDLGPLVRALLGELGLRTTPGGDRITVLPLPTVRGDAAGLRAVLRNVLDNAVRHRRTLVPLRVEIGGTSDGVRARLWIRDNGRGMSAVRRRLVLDPLRRPAPGPGGGLGLGLALARRIVGRQGGRISVSSVPGRGTTVRLTLPVVT